MSSRHSAILSLLFHFFEEDFSSHRTKKKSKDECRGNECRRRRRRPRFVVWRLSPCERGAALLLLLLPQPLLRRRPFAVTVFAILILLIKMTTQSEFFLLLLLLLLIPILFQRQRARPTERTRERRKRKIKLEALISADRLLVIIIVGMVLEDYEGYRRRRRGCWIINVFNDLLNKNVVSFLRSSRKKRRKRRA